MKLLIPILALILFWNESTGQSVLVKGKVTDAENGDPIPFANIVVKGTSIGTVCDFDGNYSLKLPHRVDSLSAIYIGYAMRTKKLEDGNPVILNFQLKEAGIQLQEVVIKPGENPAWPIMRQVIRHKEYNDKRSLVSYEYEAYNKIEVDIDKLSERFKKRKLIKKIQNVLDSIGKVVGEDGTPILPFFVSETISRLYFKSDPDKFKEFIEKTKISGLGSNEGSIVSQVVGSSFQDYNFYRNWLNVVNKDFVSPIADGWKLYYDYLLEDSTQKATGDWVYRITVTPKRPQDLAFKGTIWINRSDWALEKLDLLIPKDANINFVDKIKIQQELTKTTAGPYLPSKNRLTVDIANLNKNWAGMIAKFYTSTKDYVVNKPMRADFYEKPIEFSETIHKSDDGYWAIRRHDTLTLTERNVFKMIDTVKKIPAVRTYVEIVNILVNGYKRLDNLDYGPYLYTYGWNNVEGHRLRIGFRTNQFFSRKWVYSGYLAYGTRDEQLKYGFSIQHILSRKRWTVASLEHRYELEQLALIDNSLAENSLFFAFTRLGDLDRTRPYYSRSLKFNFTREVRRGLTLNLGSNLYTFEPEKNLYKFAYKADKLFPGIEQAGSIARRFESAELMAEIRYGRDEQFIENENQRISLGAIRWPILSLKYTAGLRGVGFGNVFSSDLNYHKFQFTTTQFIRYGPLGMGKASLVAGYTPSLVPYPILRSHLGNQTLFLNLSAFNMMQFFEFVSDRFVSLNYQHNFEGLGLNSMPLIRKLKWRFVATGNVLFGNVGQRNKALIPDRVDDTNIQNFNSLDPKKPYAEVGYGVENIFRLLRIDFIHRLTYLNNEGAKRFGVRFSLQFKL